ncbi:hypothetical protein [Streptomyces sp. MJM8645]|uniref:hypothetical protein n=1 Tax=Streptomycetaceae TaxID=2062 RepID=UPI0007AFA0D7|nr:hypothetical protein [Streptomyces sp. MJM8645]
MTSNDDDAATQRHGYNGHFIVNRDVLANTMAAHLSASQLELFMGVLAGAVDLTQGPLSPRAQRDLAKLQEHDLILKTAQGYEVSPKVALPRPAS